MSLEDWTAEDHFAERAHFAGHVEQPPVWYGPGERFVPVVLASSVVHGSRDLDVPGDLCRQSAAAGWPW